MSALAVEAMSDDELRHYGELLSALSSPIGMARHCHGEAFKIRSHMEAISTAFVELQEGVYDRLLITTPPQVGKSVSAGVWGQFWWLANRPDSRLALVSYGLSLAVSRGRAVRRLVQQYGSQFDLRMDPESRAANDWHLTTDGGMRCVGVGGSLTGNPADLLTIDDPHKDRAEADSQVKRDAVHDWYSSTGLSRLSPGAPVCLVQTRWHEDDLAGRRLKEEGRLDEGGRWKVLHMPALAGVGDPLGRQPGDPLEHPEIERGDRAKALKHWYDKRDGSSARDWGALYMGDPKPPAGALASTKLMARQTHYGELPDIARVAVAVDPSGGGRDTAGIIGGFTDTEGRLYWTHDRTGVMPSEDWAREACILAAEIDADRIVLEANYGGDQTTALIRFAWKALLQEWEEARAGDGPGGEANPYDRPMPFLAPVHSRRGKFLRAEPVAAFLSLDRVRLLPGMPELVNEWCSWQPDSPESPGRIDASVHLAYALVKALPAGNVVSSAANVPKSTGNLRAVIARGEGLPPGMRPGPRIPRRRPGR